MSSSSRRTKKKSKDKTRAKEDTEKNNVVQHGIYIFLEFMDLSGWTTKKYDNLMDCIDETNIELSKLVKKSDKVYIKYYSIIIDGGIFVVKRDLEDELAVGGVYNVCSDNDILKIKIGNSDTIINKFSVAGKGAAEIRGSCCFEIINLSAVEESTSENVTNKHFPNFSLHQFIWSGALWFDFLYTNHDLETKKDEWSLTEYHKDDYKLNAAPRADQADWVDKNTIDMTYITTCTVRLPAVDPLIFPKNISRKKPLFILNMFSSLRHQMWNSSVYSYVGPILSSDQIPLVVVNNNLAPFGAHPDWLFTGIKIGAEIFGKFLPTCFQGKNLCKVGILNSSLSGKIILESKAIAISNTYILAVGTDDGKPLTKAKPITKPLIIHNGPAISNMLQQKPQGVLAPARVILDGNSFVCSSLEISVDNYSTNEESKKYLPWEIINEKGHAPPILTFSSNLYWLQGPPPKKGALTEKGTASGGIINHYGAIHLTNFPTAHVVIEHKTS